MFDFEKGRVKLIRGGRYPHCNTVFIDDEHRALIDAASKEETLRAINRERPLEILIVSHGHEDHIMYNYLFPDARFWVPQEDAPVFKDIDRLIDGYAPESEDQRREWRRLLIEVCHYEVRDPDWLFADGDILEFGTTRCQVIHTPGHTPGHCAFHFLEERVIYLADLDLVKAGPYYGDTTSSLEDTIHSLERIASIDVDFYLTGHGEGIYDGNPDHIYRYLQVIREREGKLLEFLSGGPKSLEEITGQGIIYGPPRVIGGFWDVSTSERAMMLQHLEYLAKQGRLEVEGGLHHLVE
ncbi:MAG: MBL fold metallo-hydrolase [Deltaproteobacteria bacterium]|nr:MAG: MBL fold metallo-hydrolase [Deltaproteobacteria bacterium]